MPGFGTQSRKRRRSVSRLRHRVQLQKREQTELNDRGQPIYTWITIDDSWPCSINTLNGSEAENARQLQTEATHVIEARFDRRVDDSMRLVFRGSDVDSPRHLYIGYVTNVDEVGRFMTLLVSEKKG